MPLLLSYRRWWAIFVVGVLFLPAIGLVLPDLPAPMRTVAAPAERWWLQAAARLDPYINNVFGFRGAVLAAHAAYGRALNSTRERPVIRGESGALFFKDEMALEQSLGLVVRPALVERQADRAKELAEKMAQSGGRFVMVVPPNAHTVNFELLPAWARAERKPFTEYDLMAQEAKKRGFAFLDLRPVMAKAKTEAPVYSRIDTHWNSRGALIGFNAAMAAVGRPDLQVSPDDALEPPSPTYEGDLARLLGETPTTPDVEYRPKGPMTRPQGTTPIAGIAAPTSAADPFFPQAYITGHSGPRIMVIGDSYTQYFWAGLLASRASAVAWMHHRSCAFDASAVDRFKPDILIYAPTERALACRPGT